MQNLLVAASPLSALITAVFCLFFWSSPKKQRGLNLVGSLLHFLFAILLFVRVRDFGPQALALGGWAAPYGIAYVADLTSSILLVVTGLLSTAMAIYNFGGGIDTKREALGYHAASQFLIFGVSGAFVSGDLFHLYVCFEILLMASFVLLVMGNTREQLAAAFKYVVINLLASTFFLLSTGLLYAQVGTLNFADLYVKISSLGELPGSLKLISRLMFVGFAIKAGLFPLFFWLPASYHTPPIPTAALFAGLLTKVGIYSILRLYTFVFPSPNDSTLNMLWMISVATMVVGVFGAVSKNSIRRILSIHIISQVGYVTLALALHTPLALAAALYYMIHNMIAKTNLFLISGIIESATHTDDLKKVGGLFARTPWLSIIFLISALGLAGLPPFSGFFAKLFVIQAALEKESFLSILAVLSVGVLTLFSMLKIWNEAFWKATPSGTHLDIERSFLRSPFTPQMLTASMLSLLVLLMGVFAGPCLELFLDASRTALNPSAYVEAVLGHAPSMEVSQ